MKPTPGQPTMAAPLRRGYGGQARMRALRDMTVPELREQYREVFGEPVRRSLGEGGETRSTHKGHLWRTIAWRIQGNQEGDLPERARRRAADLANDADVRVVQL